MIKLNHLRFALVTASILVAQQIIGTSWMLNSRENPSRFDQPDMQRRHSIDGKERRHARLIEPPTNIYVLGERNSGTTFTAKGMTSAQWHVASDFPLFLVSSYANLFFLSHVHFIFVFPCHPWSVLRQAFDAPNEPDQTRKHEYFSSDIPVLLHKHMFRHFLLNETELDVISRRTDILWLFAVRSPCEVRMYTNNCWPTFLSEVDG